MKPEGRKDVHNSQVPVLCRACEARHRGVCGTLTEEQLLFVSKHAVRKFLPSGTHLANEKEDVTTYGNILSGVIKLTKMLADGRQQIVGLQFAPDFLGRPFKRQTEIAAQAATEVKLCSFPAHVLDAMIKETPELEHRLHEQALKELDEARDWMLTLGRKTASEKVASFIHMIATHIDPDFENPNHIIRFELPLKRADIADFLGLTIETVSRQLTKLRKAGVIELENNRTVTVPSLSRLENECELDR